MPGLSEMKRNPFAQLSEGLQREISAASSQRSLAAGAALVDERGTSDSLYLLTSGWAYRYATARDGARQILAVLLPGDFCNLDAVSYPACDYGIQSLTPISVSRLPCAQIDGLADEHPALMQLFLRSMSIENARLGRWTLYLGRKSASARLAHFLSEIAVRLTGAAGDEGCTFDLPLTQEKIADVLGLTPVHVNRTLHALRAQGVVEVQGRAITIPSLAALFRVAEFDAGYLHRQVAATHGGALEWQMSQSFPSRRSLAPG
jgi:CRP-like cAMP-binding protein